MPQVQAIGTITTSTSKVATSTLPGTDPFAIVEISGTFTSVQFVIEASIDSGTSYFGIPAHRVEAFGVETSTISPVDSTTRLWQVACGGYTNIQVRATAWGTGTANIRILTSAVAVSQYPEAAFTVPGDLSIPTFGAAYSALALPASCTDFVTITGSATRTVKVKKIGFSLVATAAAASELIVLLRSTADTGGTQGTTIALPVAVPVDSNYPAATAVLASYTAVPTLGTLVGSIYSTKYTIPALATGVPIEPQAFPLVLDFVQLFGQPVTLRGAAQQLCLNLAASSPGSGASSSGFLQFLEY